MTGYFFKTDSSIIEDNVSIGLGTKVWYFSHVSEGAKIGRNCNIGDHCFIGKKVIVGDDCRLGNDVSVVQGVIIKDKVYVGPGVKFTNVRKPKAIKRGKILDTIIEECVTIEAGCTIQGGVKIGKNSIIGAGSVVISDIAENIFACGNPATFKKRINEEN